MGPKETSPNIASSFVKAPKLPNSLSIDPFLSNNWKDVLFYLVIVNETKESITLPCFQVLGTVKITNQPVSKVASVKERPEPPNDPTLLASIESAITALQQRNSLQSFFLNNFHIFAFKVSELGCIGLLKHTLYTQGFGPIRSRPYQATSKQNERTKQITDEL